MTARKMESAKPVISLLGAPRIDLKGEPVALPRRRTRALLYFLAAAPGDHGRDELVDLLWPNLDPAKGRRQLSDALSDLRRTLGGDVIVSDSETVALAGATCDASVFAAAVDEAGRLDGEAANSKLSEALDLYGGEFLSGIRIEGSEGLDEWVQEQRLSLSVAALGAFARLGALRLERGDSSGAIAIAQRGLEFDSLREDLWRVLIEARFATGDRAGALAEYTRCSETLQRELGVMPEAETEALRRRVSAERGTPAAGAVESTAAKAKPPLPFSLHLPGSSLALVGREHELGSLLRAWDSARDRGGGLVAIEGEPGIGKSRLATEFAARAAGSGAIVLAARCPDLNDPPPYGPIEEAIRGVLPSMPAGAFSKLGAEWLPWVGRLLPELGLGVDAREPLSPEEEKLRLSEAAGRALDVVAGERPLLLTIEDLHWAHPSTVLLLHAVARRHRRMLVLTTMRDTEPLTAGTEMARRMLADLAKEGLATSISLGTLAATDTEALVSLAIESAGAGGKTNVRAVARLAEGQPLFAIELTRAVLESPDDPDLPASLTNAIGLRIDRASDFARRILELAAVCGRPVTPQLLARAVGVEPATETLVDAIEELTARRLLQEDDDGLTLSHGLIRATVYKSLSVSRRRALHARAAAALESGHELPAGARSDALARHYRLAGDLVPAGEHLLESGDRALSMGEIDTAVRRFVSAADCLRKAGRERDAALAMERTGDAFLCACDIFEAVDTLRDALAAWEAIPGNEDAIARVHTRLAEYCSRWGWYRVDRAETWRHVNTAISYIESHSTGPNKVPDDERSRALAARSFLRSFDGDIAGAERDANEAVRLAHGSPRAWIVAKDAECLFLLKRARLEAALQSTLDKVPAATSLSDYFELGDAYGMAWVMSRRLGDMESAANYARLELDADVRSRLPARIALSSTNYAESLIVLGRFEEAERILLEHPLAPELEVPTPHTFARRDVLLAEIAASRGDIRSARRLLAKGKRIKKLVPEDHFYVTDCLDRAREAIRQAEAKRKVAPASR